MLAYGSETMVISKSDKTTLRVFERRVLIAIVVGRRERGRPKLRWEDGVREDAKKLGESNWWNAVRNGDSWQNLQKKALAQNGL